jgi:hypothetical protein
VVNEQRLTWAALLDDTYYRRLPTVAGFLRQRLMLVAKIAFVQQKIEISQA